MIVNVALYPSAWADQRDLLGDKEKSPGDIKISPSGFGVRQLAFFKAFYRSHSYINYDY